MTAPTVERPSVDVRARQAVLTQYRKDRRRKLPHDVIVERRDSWALYVASALAEGGPEGVSEFALRCFAVADEYERQVWAKWMAKERPNFWRSGKLGGAS
ncbi:MAG TPA: hypothetical protein VGL39_27770 [Jatrophihabitantaceae bacterium]|jgi:hypothetical protein